MAADEPLLIEGYLPRLMMGNSDIRDTFGLADGRFKRNRLNVNSYLVQDNGFINVRLDSDAADNRLDNHIFIDLEQGKTNAEGEIQISTDFMRRSRSTCFRYPDPPHQPYV